MFRSFLAISVFLSACADRNLDGSSRSREAPVSSVASPTSPVATSPELKSTVTEVQGTVIDDERADPPVKIQGSYMSCSTTLSAARDVVCTVYSTARQPVDVDVKAAYVKGAAASQWTETTFVKGSNAGEYLVRIPAQLSDDFVVALNSDDLPLYDWVNKSLSLRSKVKDGGFEEFTGFTDFDFFSSAESPYWKAERSSSSQCQQGDPLIEVQVAGPSTNQSSFQGNNRIELDSACEIPGRANVGQNVAVYQDLSVTAGNPHLFRYNVARRLQDTQDSRLRVTLGDVVVVDQLVTDTNWNAYRIVAKPSAATLRVSFEERGVENSSGALIDAVEVFDLGSPPF